MCDKTLGERLEEGIKRRCLWFTGSLDVELCRSVVGRRYISLFLPRQSLPPKLRHPPTPPSSFSSFLDLSPLSCLAAALPCGEREEEEEEDNDKKALVAANLIFPILASDNIYFITRVIECFNETPTDNHRK